MQPADTDHEKLVEVRGGDGEEFHAFEHRERGALGHRGLPDDTKVEQFLQVLDSHGGKMTEVALSRALSLPELRLRGLVAQMSRLLNLDDYLVVSRDEASSTVELNRTLLLKQFDLVED